MSINEAKKLFQTTILINQNNKYLRPTLRGSILRTHTFVIEIILSKQINIATYSGSKPF